MRRLKERIRNLEVSQLTLRHPKKADEDALAVYIASKYLDSTTAVCGRDIADTEIYKYGKAICDARYGCRLLPHADEHFRRFTRASGEFELAFGREPKPGDILLITDVYSSHNAFVRAAHFSRLIDAWNRQVPHLQCPLTWEGERLYRRMKPVTAGDEVWEEDSSIGPYERWARIPEISAKLGQTQGFATTLIFEAPVKGRHRCRVAAEGDEGECEKRATNIGTEPEDYAYAKQRHDEILLDCLRAAKQHYPYHQSEKLHSLMAVLPDHFFVTPSP